MVTALKIEILCNYDSRDQTYYKDTFEVISINKRYLVKQQYYHGTNKEKKEETNATYTIKQKKKLIQIIKSKISDETYGIMFDISQGKCDIISDCIFDEETENEKETNKTLRKFLDILDNIEHDENELKKILIKNTKNTVTSLPPELTEMILKNI